MARIVVIDDERDVLQSIVDMLEGDGHEVVGAADGLAGLELYARHRPELVVTDLLMPHLDGLELIRRLRCERGVKIIAISGSGAALLDAAQGAGAAATLRKPFGAAELTAVVRRVLGAV